MRNGFKQYKKWLQEKREYEANYGKYFYAKNEEEELLDHLGITQETSITCEIPNLEIAETTPEPGWYMHPDIEGISVKFPKIVGGVANQQNSLRDFERILERNLINVGAEGKKQLILISRYITGAFMIRLPLLLVGSTAERMANAISMSISGELPTIIHVSNKVIDEGGLITTLKSVNSGVIVIRSSSEFLNENLFLRLREEVQDKLLLFSVTLTDALTILPPSIFSYVGIIDCELCWMFLQTKKLERGDCSSVYQTTRKEHYQEFIVFLKSYSDFLGLNNGYIMTRAEMLSKLFMDTNVSNPKSNPYTYIFPLLHELYVISKVENKTKEFMEFLDQLPDSKSRKFLENIHDLRV